MAALLPQTRYQVLARGDQVRVENLSSEAGQKLNGLEARVVKYHHAKDRYEVRIGDQEKTHALKPANLVPPQPFAGEASTAMHVLIPCHLDSPRRVLLFRRCAQSVAFQQRLPGMINVFVSLSGSLRGGNGACSIIKDLRARADENPAIRWHVLDNGHEQRSQFEHLDDMLEASMELCSSAWLMFLDNDDLWHPWRINVFHRVLSQRIAAGEGDAPFSIPCKLVLKNMTGDDGRLDQLICGYDDWDTWKQDPALASQITETAAGLHGEDCDEFFDYCVPTSVFRDFMRTTPARIKAHTYCDLRFDALLRLITDDDQVGLGQEIPWLMAHHKITMDVKQACFDSAATGSLHTDATRASMSVSSAPEDAELVSRFQLSITPEQVAMTRKHVESAAIQHIACDDEFQSKHDRKHNEYRSEVLAEINKSRKSPGFGEALWAQSCELFTN
jgi:hypothetical protein